MPAPSAPLLVVSSQDPTVLGRRLAWGKTETFCRSDAKVLVAGLCVVEIAKGTKLTFLRQGGPCGGIRLLAGHIRVWPLCPMDVASGTGHITVRAPSALSWGSKGPHRRGPTPPLFRFEPAPLAEVPTPLDPDSVLPRTGGKSGGVSLGSSGSVSAVGGGSMCLDTSGGSGAAGSVEQGPTTIQKPTPKARVILKVEVER